MFLLIETKSHQFSKFVLIVGKGLLFLDHIFVQSLVQYTNKNIVVPLIFIDNFPLTGQLSIYLYFFFYSNSPQKKA